MYIQWNRQVEGGGGGDDYLCEYEHSRFLNREF